MSAIDKIIDELKKAQNATNADFIKAKAAVKEHRATLTTINKALRSFGVKVRKKADDAPVIPKTMAGALSAEGRAKLSRLMKKRHAEARKAGYNSYQEMAKAKAK